MTSTRNVGPHGTVLFVETPLFTRQIGEAMSAEECRAVQVMLARRPAADFAELAPSVREMKTILRGELAPGRVTRLAGARAAARRGQAPRGGARRDRRMRLVGE